MTTPRGQAGSAAAGLSDRPGAGGSNASDTSVEAPTRTGPSIHVRRARKLLLGGLAGGLAAAVLSLVLFTVLDGTRGLASAVLAAAMVLFFYGVGQLVMVAFADAGARTLLAVSMASYTARVVILGLVLLLYNKHTDAFPALWPMAIFVTTIAVVAGWIAVEIWVFSRLRIGVYDTEYVSPPVEEDQQ
jgi:predicted permease